MAGLLLVSEMSRGLRVWAQTAKAANLSTKPISESNLKFIMAKRTTVQVCLLMTACSVIPSAFPTLAQARSSRSRTAAAHPSTVVIDPGHGGFDRGGIPGQRVPEKDIALDVGLRLKLKLQAAGYRVIMTRDADVFVPLPTRA